jgi:hypothetical protein
MPTGPPQPPPFLSVPAHRANSMKANRPEDLPINWIALYLSGRRTLDAIQTYRVAPTGRACHYLISGAGEIIQMVPESDWTLLTGNRQTDKHSIFMEVELENGAPATDEAMATTALLLQQICQRYAIPFDRTRIIGAHEVPGSAIRAPATPFDWHRLLTLAVGSSSIIVDTTMADRFRTMGNWTRMSASPLKRARHYMATQAAPRHDLAYFRVPLPQTGRYEVAVWYPSSPANCPQTPLILCTAKGDERLYLDQRQGGGGWIDLGTYPFVGGDYWAAALSTWAPAAGWIVADSIRFTYQHERREA